MNFEHYLEKTNLIIKELACELGNPADEHQAFRLLRSVFHAMRQILSTEESFDLISQLPMFLKAVYVDGWKPRSLMIRKKHIEDLIEAVRSADRQTAERDLGNDLEAKQKIQAVFHVLKQHVSEGEFMDITLGLPLQIREFVVNS